MAKANGNGSNGNGAAGIGRKWAEVVAYFAANPSASNADAIRDCGVAERTFYNWAALPEFQSDVEDAIRKALRGRWPSVVDQVYRDCMAAETGAARTAAARTFLQWSRELDGDGATVHVHQPIRYQFPHQRKEPGENRVKALSEKSNGNGNGNGAH